MTFCYPNYQIVALPFGAAAVAYGANISVSRKRMKSEVVSWSCALRTVDPNITPVPAASTRAPERVVLRSFGGVFFPRLMLFP